MDYDYRITSKKNLIEVKNVFEKRRFCFTKNVTVYNYKDDKHVKVGKTRMNRNNTINLTRFSLFETTNKYKVEFSKGLINKMQGKMITIRKGNNKVKILVNARGEKYSVETRL